MRNILLIFISTCFSVISHATSIPCHPESAVEKVEKSDVVMSARLYLDLTEGKSGIIAMEPIKMWKGEPQKYFKIYLEKNWKSVPDKNSEYLVFANWKYLNGKKVLTIPLCYRLLKIGDNHSLGEDKWSK